MRITVIDKSGNVLGDSSSNPVEMENHLKRPEVQDAISKGIGQSTRYSNTINKEMVYVAVPLRDSEGRIEGIVRTSLPTSSIRDAFLPIKNKIIYTGFILIIVAIALSYLSSKSFSNSLSRIIGLSEEIAKGNFKVNMPAKDRKGELAKVSFALNKMAEKLDELFQRVAFEKGQLQAVLSSMNEGVMLLSTKGKIMLVNDALSEMFELKGNPIDRQYWEVLRNKDINELIENVFRSNKNSKKEISIFYPRERNYLVNVRTLDYPEKVLIFVVFDITDFKSLEKIKADFIANVSHELRTPLTAIKGYTETLEEEAYENREDRRHFLGIIKRHTDRLINIVSDLLVLSEIESKESLSLEMSKSDFEDVDLNEVVKSSYESLRRKVSEKNLQIEINVKEGIPGIKGNRFLLEQMLINLIDNAVKYTPERGRVTISAYSEDSNINLEISDTGIGIPKENLNRIFERFYRVDNTRSRKLGGTGLGLSIVKHIAIIHNGKIDVESEVGKGSRFLITLPT
jgi:two-component system, OmpR family, phosphate regulon sensor histidine kinase PhoR